MLQLLAAAFVLTASSAIADPVSGRATVIDGNTLRIEQQTYRLDGIDAPEKSQLCAIRWQCGKAASAALHNLARKTDVVCDPKRTDGYGRTFATCRAGETDLNAELVRRGLALASKDSAYSELEAAARSRRVGLWAGKFQNPAEYRATRGAKTRGLPQDASPAAPPLQDAPIGEPDSPWLAHNIERPAFAPGAETILD